MTSRCAQGWGQWGVGVEGVSLNMYEGPSILAVLNASVCCWVGKVVKCLLVNRQEALGVHSLLSLSFSQPCLQLCDISSDGFLSLMDDNGEIRDDIKLPDGDVGAEIKRKHENDEQFMVTVLKSMGTEAAIATKNMAK